MAEFHGRAVDRVFHEGEVALQSGLGVSKRMAEIGARVVRDYMPDQHRDFYGQIPFILAGAVDPEGAAWATILSGPSGFIASPDPRKLLINAAENPADPAWRGLRDGDAVGLLGIELHTRRRNRLNGTVRRDASGGFAVEVEHSFGNCPQYIQLRDWEPAPGRGEGRARDVETLTALAGRAREMIEEADTFFVASYVDLDGTGRQVDVSHRGGKAGFVRIGDDGVLTIPDFAGNLHFNTLGNFLLNPRAGLIFIDFETGDILQLTGLAEVVLDSPEIGAFQGAERLWTFKSQQILLRRAAFPLRLTMRTDGWSPNSLMTGSWDEASARVEAAQLAKSWRQYRVSRIVDESSVIRSFHLEPDDDKGLIAHEAGQHLPVRIAVADDPSPLHRNYTLSVAPSDGFYRISVKRDGRASAYLHDHFKVGDLIEARGPAGSFTVDPAARRPAVLIAAGVGITPMLAMLRHLLFEGKRKRRIRPTWLIQAARSRAERAFDEEIDRLIASADGSMRLVRITSEPGEEEQAGRDYDIQGRFDAGMLRELLPFDDYDFYMCGPGGFMQSVYDGLRDLNVSDERIHFESFGPSTLARRLDSPAPPPVQPSDTPVPVAFAEAGKEARWKPDGGSLLELAEERGLSPPYSCRSGSCGSCAVKLLQGTVAYRNAPTASIEPGEVLLCSAVPAHGSEPIVVEA